MEGLRDQFLVEGRELVENAAADLLALAGEPDRIDSAFRAVHTLKGATGLFDLKPMGALLHAAEDLLGALRDGTLSADGTLVDLLLKGIDQAARWLDCFEAADTLPADAPAVAQRLGAALRRKLPAAPPVLPQSEAAPDQPWILRLLAGLDPGAAETALTGTGLRAIRYLPTRQCFFDGDDPVALFRAIPELRAVSIAGREPWGPLESFDPFGCNLVLDGLSAAPAVEIRAALSSVLDQVQIVAVERQPMGHEPGGDAAGAKIDGSDAASRTFRVESDRIETLAGIADQVVIASNALAHLAAEARRGLSGEALVRGVLTSHAELERLSGQLHRAVMRVRLVPLAALFRSFPRLVREIGAQLGKKLDLSLQGEAIEIDKSLVDGLFEPILHLLRNAVDHGIEDSSQRLAAGKPPRGVITLGAKRLLETVAIDIADDGRGIDVETVRRTAVARGLLSAATAAALPEERALELLFAPGFSTASAVTDLSGRGVGLDAVRTAVARLGGHVMLSSRFGQGTSIRLSLPAAIVLTGIVTVECGGERYGVAMDDLVETLRLPADRVVPIRAGRAFTLRDRVVPIFNLAELLGVTASAPNGDLKLLVFGQGEAVSAVAVDGFGDRQSLLLRPRNGLLSGLRGIAGTALLGTGQILMVLDLAELVA
jgi:two-component system, chemotaxis family, sensor kinase CheA